MVLGSAPDWMYWRIVCCYDVVPDAPTPRVRLLLAGLRTDDVPPVLHADRPNVNAMALQIASVFMIILLNIMLWMF